jgi:HlyD family secretion protein
MTARRRGWIGVGIAAGAVVVALLLLGLAGHGQTPDVSVAPVTRQTLENWISTNGAVEPIQPYTIRARLDTFVTGVHVTDGQPVKRGQLLLTLDVTAAAAQLAQARQDLLAAQQQLQYAEAGGPPEQLAQLKSDLTQTQATRDRLAAQRKTLEKLVEEQAATRDELDQNALKLRQTDATLAYLEEKKQALARQAQYDANSARLQIEQAQARISDLSKKVASARVTAPVSGTVYALPVKDGDYVDVGQPLVSVADLQRVRVRAYVDEVNLGSIAPGEEVEVQWDGFPGRTWYGRTEVIPKQVVPYQQRRVGEVLCSISGANADLLPNTNVDVQILAAHKTGALAVPRAAVQGEANNQYVYVVQGDRLRRTPVTVGIASAEMFQILEGLHEGEQVALPGSTNLHNGLEIHPVEVQ